MLAAEMERLHPNLFHTVSADEFRGAVERLCARLPRLRREGALLEVMGLAALPGPRDGHTGLYPLDEDHGRPLHLFPLRLWSFAEGFVVVRAPSGSALVGARLVAIDGTPVERVVERLDSYVGRDNEFSLALRLPEFLVSGEVLNGLGVIDDPHHAQFELATRTGGTVVEELQAMPAPAYRAEVGDPRRLPPPPPPAETPLWLRDGAAHSVCTLDEGRAVYAVYAVTAMPSDEFLAELRRWAGHDEVRRVIVDLRRNGGGDNTTYGSLVDVLSDPRIDRPGRLTALVGRMTYSAAGNLSAELQHLTGARFVGEPTGGSPHNYGDTVPVSLPDLGWTVRVATLFHATSGGPGERLAVEPDVFVPLPADDWLGGRDPVLEAALQLPA